MGLAAPTLLAHGSDDLKRRLLPRAITGEDTWCQLFSEPTNGSDLAGLATHAERDGDEWVVNGQKLWSTSAHHADLGLLLARTDPDVPKHRGISYFVLPMHQPGVEVRPVHQMNEHSSFNEVFLSDARVPADNLVGRPGDGWRIAMTTLAFERQFATVRAPLDGEGHRAGRRGSGRRGRGVLQDVRLVPAAGRAGRPRAAGRRARSAAPTTRSPARRWPASSPCAGPTSGPPAGPRPLAPPVGHPARRARSASSPPAASPRRRPGRTRCSPAPTASCATATASSTASITEVLLSVPAQSIAGGTDEIQHNIIGEKVLDLPREPSVDRDIPYREIRR